MKSLLYSSILSAGLILGLSGCDNAYSSAEETSERPDRPLEWMTDYNGALEASLDSGKPVLINFTGSDWCPPCIQMKGDVLETATFHDYAEDNLILLELDFPRNAPQDPDLVRQNRQLADTFAIQGYPTFVVVDGEGNELRRTVGYLRGGPQAFITWIDG